MVMIGKVLRMHHREKKSVREIAKATSLARNTVRKYLRLGKAEQPQYRRPAVPTKLAPYVEQLEQALRADARRPKKERRSAKALLEQLKAAGYDGGYSRLTDYIRAWRAAQGGAAVGDAPRVRIVVAPINPGPGAAMKDESGSIRTSIQGQGGSAHAAAGERASGRGGAGGWRQREHAGALA